jgi:hypothetical protein
LVLFYEQEDVSIEHAKQMPQRRREQSKTGEGTDKNNPTMADTSTNM